MKVRECTFKTESGDNSEEDPPVPIPNTEVKLFRAEDTWRATAWEIRALPVRSFFLLWLRGQVVKTPPFHGGNSSSSLDGVIRKGLPFEKSEQAFFVKEAERDGRDWRNWQTRQI